MGLFLWIKLLHPLGALLSVCLKEERAFHEEASPLSLLVMITQPDCPFPAYIFAGILLKMMTKYVAECVIYSTRLLTHSMERRSCSYPTEAPCKHSSPLCSLIARQKCLGIVVYTFCIEDQIRARGKLPLLLIWSICEH